MGVIDAKLPAPLKPTVFDLWGDGAFFAMLLLAVAGVAPSVRTLMSKQTDR